MDITNIKDIKINFNQGSWDPKTQSIVLSYDSASPCGFNVKFVPVYKEIAVDNTDLAKEVLRKYTK